MYYIHLFCIELLNVLVRKYLLGEHRQIQ